MSIITTYPQNSPTNYLYDGTKIEVTTSVAKLLATTSPPVAYLYAKLDENAGLVAIDSTGNGRHGAFQGGLDENDWVTGKINSAIEGIGTTNGFINFDGVGDFSVAQPFSLECWLKFTSAVTQSVVSKQRNVGTFEGYAINLAAGKIRLVIRDNASNIIALESNSTYNDNIFHHIVCTYDGSGTDAGATIYIDNTVAFTVTTPGTLTGLLNNTADFQISGRDGNNITLAVGSVVDEVAVYERELTAAEVAFRWNGGAGTQILPGASTSFPIDNPTIQPRGTIVTSSLTDFDATVTEIGNDEIRFVIVDTGIDKYWNGSAWVNSTSFAETNTASEIKANISTYPITGSTSIIYKAFLHSDDGSTTPELASVSIQYELAGLPQEIVTCTVFGTNKQTNGDIDDSPFTIQLSNDAVQYKDVFVMRDDVLTVTPNSITGEWEIDLVETVNMPPSVYYNFIFDKVTYRKDVPADVRKEFWSLPDA